MNRAPGERFTYRVERNDYFPAGRLREWLVIRASNMGDGEYVALDYEQQDAALIACDALNREETNT